MRGGGRGAVANLAAAALTAGLCLSMGVVAHAGKKSKDTDWQQQQQEQLRQQQAEQAARAQRELARQQQQMAERQRQMQKQMTQQQRQQQSSQERGDTSDSRQRQSARPQNDDDDDDQDLRPAQLDLRSAQDTDRQQRLQRALDQQRQLQQQVQQRAQQQQQQLQQRAQQQQQARRNQNDDSANSKDDGSADVAASDQDPDQNADEQASAGPGSKGQPQKLDDRSRRHHRRNQPNLALEMRPEPPVPGRAAPAIGPNTNSSPRPQGPPSSAEVVPEVTPDASSPRPSRPAGPVEIAATHLTTAEVEKAKALGFHPVGETVLPRSNTSVQQLRAPAGIGADQARAMLLQQMPLGKFAVNHTYHIFKDQQGEADKRVPSACADNACGPIALINWNPSLRSCTKDVKIGIIDTSFDLSHPAFRELKVSSGQFLGGEKPSPFDWHGTAVLSLLAGDPQSGTPGLISDAHFLLATAFKTDASGNASTDSIRLVSALEWLEKLDVKYVNMSFSGPRDPMVEAVIQRMRREGVVFIAAAGNQGPVAPPSYPAAYPDVIAVTAVNRNGENYRHANRGSYVDVSAPGVDVLAALPDGKSGYRTGTSFAAPFVTAIVATQEAASMTTRVVWKPELLSHMTLRDLGPPGPDPIYGRGLALAPASCMGPGTGTVAAGNRPRETLPPPMGAGGPTIINTSAGAEAQ